MLDREPRRVADLNAQRRMGSLSPLPPVTYQGWCPRCGHVAEHAAGQCLECPRPVAQADGDGGEA